MFAKLMNKSLKIAFIVRAFPALMFAIIFLAMTANAQTVSSNASTSPVQETPTETASTPVLMPVWKSYKEVTVGMSADAVKDKLGKAKVSDKDGFYYEMSDEETLQIGLDAEQKVRVISITYKVKEGNAPKFEDVLGADPSVEPNGAVYKLVRYPEAGYWVAYNRTAGDDATVTVTIQKL